MKWLLFVVEIIIGILLVLTIATGNAEPHHYIWLAGDIITFLISIKK